MVVAVADDSNDQYNAAHVQQMVDEAYQRACVSTPSVGSATSGPSGEVHVDSYGYHEEFDHYDFSNAYVQLKGYRITYTTTQALPTPQTLTLSISQIQSFSGSVSVNGSVTASLESAIIGGISASTGYQTTFTTGYQTGVTASLSVEVPVNTAFTITAWYEAVSSSGTAYYRCWEDGIPGSTMSARPCGAFVPLVYSGNGVVYFDPHAGTNP